MDLDQGMPQKLHHRTDLMQYIYWGNGLKRERQTDREQETQIVRKTES